MDTLFKRLLDYYQIDEKEYEALTAPVTIDNFLDGHDFNDIETIARVVKEAIQEKKKIFIYGDYDCDGIMSISILVKLFKNLNYPVSYHVPNRYTDGYGLTRKRAEEIFNNGYDLLITVDNGITAFEPIAYLKEKGVKVLVFDHHQPEENHLPDADYILHPLVSEFGEIATSAGFVTFMFAYHFLGRYDTYLATLAAISLISDMMPLKSYNRNLLRLVIEQFKDNTYPCIDLLKEKEPFNETSIGVRIAPKINAIGRLIDDDILLRRTVEFLTSDNKELLLNYNSWINEVNNERKELTKIAVEDSKEINVDEPAIVAIVNQKEGIIGLIANNLMKKYHKPTVIFALDQNGEIYKGSCRAPEGFNVVDAFKQLENLLETFGGHALAGGCSLKKDNFAFFKEGFNQIAEETTYIKEAPATIPLYINEINFENYDLIKSFSPFGESWVAPLFKLKHIKVQSLMYSRDLNHIITSIGNSARINGFYFSKEMMSHYQYVDMIGTLRTSTYFNKTNVEFIISELEESK